MAPQFRTAFMAPSGFATAAVAAPKAITPVGERKPVAKGRPAMRAPREMNGEPRKKTEAA